ncbi:hypothetical protein [Colwellia sp. RSH04]|uniref:hypothetical protein n=1 Tax=Colwellia sp. RSH04 TaxID=2305464 RepID=UPI000E57DA0A|nr:hypothetical protein [Colwellia sp. RSH04]RHW76340.1 hypothetical protein D1094_08455 [Colwellia sp. RSH04]
MSPYLVRMLNVFILLALLAISTNIYACNKAQIIDYDYQINDPLGAGYATHGRFWALDNEQVCTESLKYGACISVKPITDGVAEVTVNIKKDQGTSSSFTQKLKYNSSNVLRFEAISMDVYLKLFVSNTIADLKMSGKSCSGGFPSLPRQLTRKELDNMFKG